MTTSHPDMHKIFALHQQIGNLRTEMLKIIKAAPREVSDYTFSSPAGDVRLSDLFEARQDLLMVHNMGTGCGYCTLWADGFNGDYPHLLSRAAFCLSSPDAPDVQQAFAASRGWRFPMVSHAGTSFAADMGYHDKQAGYLPGLSAFHMEDGRITRVATTPMGPYDDFCSVWHMFALLKDGGGDWQPQLRYE